MNKLYPIRAKESLYDHFRFLGLLDHQDSEIENVIHKIKAS